MYHYCNAEEKLSEIECVYNHVAPLCNLGDTPDLVEVQSEYFLGLSWMH